MSANVWINLAYILASFLFIVGLKQLGSPATARRGNWLSAGGMLIAIVATMSHHKEITTYTWIVVGIIVGSAIGVYAAKKISMTAMPQMVALFNGSGGIASLLVGWAVYHAYPELDTLPILLAVIIGGLTFTGSIVAWAKLSEITVSGVRFSPPFSRGAIVYGIGILIGLIAILVIALISWAKYKYAVVFVIFLLVLAIAAMLLIPVAGIKMSRPLLFKGQRIVNGSLLGLVVILGIVLMVTTEKVEWAPAMYTVFVTVIILSMAIGVMAVIPIGGADMPVVISLLNSYSGLAACAAGFAINNNILIIAGSLVGASGIILTRIMCLAMNRSLVNVLFSGFGAVAEAGETGEDVGEVKPISVDQAYYILEAAHQVIVVPGYGLAVAQAQHAIRELAELLEKNGAEVRYAIHPVAGRMPGHMNVLLAEASVPYDQLIEPGDINPIMGTIDVCIVVGANDVVNPAARENESSPIYGMPIIDVDKARTVIVMKRSMATGFAGIENPLFFLDNTRMLFGDAKASVQGLVGEFKG